MSNWIQSADGKETIREDTEAVMGRLRAENERLREEVVTWKARWFAAFWRLPDDTNLAELREESEAARKFVQASTLSGGEEKGAA